MFYDTKSCFVMEKVTGLKVSNHSSSNRLVDIKIENDYLDKEVFFKSD